jgi:FdhE protein
MGCEASPHLVRANSARLDAEEMRTGKWDARIRRACDLAKQYPFAAEGLRFYAQVAESQKSLYSDLGHEAGTDKIFRALGALRGELDLFLLLGKFDPFLAAVERHAPAALADSARGLRLGGSSRWRDVLEDFWNADARTELSPADTLLAWMFLQPYAEYLADHTDHPRFEGTPPICPLCSSKPLTGVLRPEGDGAKRLLLCSLCATAWDFRRIVCPSCGEEDVSQLAIYSTDKFRCVRVEACDSCHRYIKTVDLTKDGYAVPAVDELATIPLDLWATENGYEKLQPNILGL